MTQETHHWVSFCSDGSLPVNCVALDNSLETQDQRPQPVSPNSTFYLRNILVQLKAPCCEMKSLGWGVRYLSYGFVPVSATLCEYLKVQSGILEKGCIAGIWAQQPNRLHPFNHCSWSNFYPSTRASGYQYKLQGKSLGFGCLIPKIKIRML